MEAHNASVELISQRLRAFYATKSPFRVYHGSTNSTRASASAKDRATSVDTSGLDLVLAVDAARRTALVEPNVPMDRLVAATLAHGLVPLVVMEFPGITAGGGFSGSAGESSSCRHGPFDATVNWIEIVVPDGRVLRASQQQGAERPDLFWGAASAFGTVGVVTLLEIRLRDAKPYVQLTHYPLPDFASANAKIQSEVADPAVDFVDGIVFSPTAAVVCSGRLVDADALPAGTRPRRYTRRGDPWFYLDVGKRVLARGRRGGDKGQPVVTTTDYVPLVDYLFRWDRGGFWVARYAFGYFFTPFNRLTRRLLDRFLRARVMYHALHKSGLSDTYIIQDVGVPYDTADSFHDWLRGEIGIYPLWLCPIRVRRDVSGPSPAAAAHGLHASFADPARTPEFMLNFGVWGPSGSRSPEEHTARNRAIEREVHGRGGNKTLYAQAFYTEDEFWAAYDRGAYEAVRARYGASHLPSVYDKTRVDEGARARAMAGSRMPAALRGRRPFQGLYGVYKAWRGGDYLLQKKMKKGREEKEEKET
ncbi:FAD-binding domain-containing protein [Xylariomycetidae sp. FL2044]|nr:FAD-binding domain-containing protein [Xylariomycetidae sp. FL2044]